MTGPLWFQPQLFPAESLKVAWYVDKGQSIHSLVLRLCRSVARQSTVKKKPNQHPQPSEGVGKSPAMAKYRVASQTFTAPGRKTAGRVCTGWENMRMEVHSSSGVHPFCHWGLFQQQKYIAIMCFMETKIIHYRDKNDTKDSTRCWSRKPVNNLLNYVFCSLKPCPFLGIFHWICSLARTFTETVGVKGTVETICWKHLLYLETRIDALENHLWICNCTLKCPCVALLIS